MHLPKYNVVLTPRIVAYFTELAAIKKPAYDLDGLVEPWLSRVEFEAKQLVELLPRKQAILDIGCGPGGVDVFLDRAWDFGAINLFDGVEAGVRKSGYKAASTPWKSVDTAAEFVTANISRSDKVTAHYVGHPLSLLGPVDLVYSSWSWGYHYPVETYIDVARRWITPDGHLVIDIRHETDGVEVAERAGFKLLTTLDVIEANADKGLRHVFEVG